MAHNSFGNQLILTSFGESHGVAVGGVIDGFPAGFPVDFNAVQKAVSRRKPGVSDYTSPRQEADRVEWLSGLYEGKTLGTPLAFMIKNTDARSSDYKPLEKLWRPSHADYTWDMKYGIRDPRGGGRASARETAARVVAGALALQYLNKLGINISAAVTAIGGVYALPLTTVHSPEQVDASPLRCLDSTAEAEMLKRLEEAKTQGDTLGGIVSCVIDGLPTGLGEPVFDKFQAVLAHAMMSINAAKGFDYGLGFQAADMKGSRHNDVFAAKQDGVKPQSNRAGGLLGGITTGLPLYFRVAFKPIASIAQQQHTVDKQGRQLSLRIGGRHDVTTVPRAVPIVEAMAALCTLDFFLLHKMNLTNEK